MKEGKLWLVFACYVVLLATPSTVWPHHSFASEFSRELPIEVVGTVTSVDWRNPHARFFVDVEDEDGNLVNWNFELRSPNILTRRGWARDAVKAGDKVSVTGFRAHNDPHVARADSVILNGKPVLTTD